LDADAAAIPAAPVPAAVAAAIAAGLDLDWLVGAAVVEVDLAAAGEIGSLAKAEATLRGSDAVAVEIGADPALTGSCLNAAELPP
jgi:hypothetical protein